jgi:hypothetical protein
LAAEKKEAADKLWAEQRAGLLKELKARFRYSYLDSASVKELSAKYNRSERAVIAAAAAQGISIGGPPNANETSTNVSQYGVLQPAANILGGCVNMWLWVILVFLVVGIFVVVKSLFV